MSSEWRQTKISDVCSLISRGVTPAYVETNGVTVLNQKCIRDGRVSFGPSRSTDQNKKKIPADKFLRNLDVLVNSTGTGTLGRVAQFFEVQKPVTVDSHITIVRPNDVAVDPLFLGYVVKGLQSQIEELAEGSTGQTELSREKLGQLQIKLPKRSDQEKFSSVFSALDDRITLLRETNTTLEDIAQALFKSWFVDFDPVHVKMQGRTPEGMDEGTAALFPDSFEDSELGPVPKGWRWGTLNELATFQNGFAFKSKDWTDAGHPVVKIGDVKPGIINLEGCSYVANETVVGLDRFKLARGDLLVGMTGYVGETGLVPFVEPAAYLNQRVGRMATKSGIADLGYLYCAVRSQSFKEFAEAQSHGSAQANVSGVSLMAFPAVIAHHSLMERFNSAIADMLECILTNHEQVRTLSAVRDTLLPRLISGQLSIGEVPEVECA